MSEMSEFRRLEVHFTTEDEALVVELDDDGDRPEVDEIIGALDADNPDAAEKILRETATGPRPIGRLGSYRRW
jgi:hypothetical protein